VPGAAYLRFDTTSLLRFKAAYVSGALPPPVVAGRASTTGAIGRRVVPFGLAETRRRATAAAQADAAQTTLEEPANPLDDTVLDVLVAQLVGQGPPPHQVWLPPLTAPPALDHLLPPLAVTPQRGLHAAGWPGNGQLSVPIGVVDKPFEQKRDLLWAPLAGAAGNLVVVGGPQSGKSTLLRGLVCSLALTHTPSEVQFYGLDFGGGTLSALEELPHVGGMAGRRDREAVLRTISELTTLMDNREKIFAQHRIDSMATFRNRRRTETLEDRPFGDIFLVVDGWGGLAWPGLRHPCGALGQPLDGGTAGVEGHPGHAVRTASGRPG
jgi:S-DNA-T family DNA segregation ATPase FtsK/SpoIIIE